ncbi:uncharacterized protein BDZ83DRAFT_299698 [Colletotrichum acutatum]|uniref:NFX1-type zinc finger-containing protein 1 n=1 Tax=Glomerella acutata TaxID=27357 RepID=A0AAD8UJL5_GLOAC|nr:uncharacterized protein BDZ83DRAFT_299698 [Colletotrichum acutatum]KAK1725552.1 hypothetical protein BDZ83DRAFT_299698 [Colletotrichum acutatum]
MWRTNGKRPGAASSTNGPCHYYLRTGTCGFGSRCKFSHDTGNKPDRREQGQWQTSNASPDDPPANARRIDGRTANASSRARNPERERLFQWKRLRPQPRQVSLLWDDTTSNFFRTALSLVEQDVSLAQEVVKEMAADGRLPLVRDVIEGVASAKTPEDESLLWESRISPLFRVLLHPTVVDSVVLEQETAMLYRLLLGVDATRLKTLFNFVFDVVDRWYELPFEDTGVSAMEALALSCGVLAKVINTSTSNIVNALFHPIVEGIKLRLDVFGNKDSDFHTLQATRHLEYVCRRLGIGHTLVDAVHISASSGAMAEFTLSQDLPGKLSKRRERHDNDHQDISDIKLMPTHQEIMSSRDEYLPVANPAQHHLQGLRGLLDRHFRLLREDTLQDLRSAIRTTVESNVKMRDVRTRVVAYDNAFAVDMAFDRWSGLEFIVQIDQPRPTIGLDKLQRGTWWTGKRLMDGALVCIVDEVGGIFFFQVSRSTIRTPKDGSQQGQGDDQEEHKNEAPRYSLLDDKTHAYVHLHLVDTGIDEIKRSLRWFKTMQVVRQHRRLLEFPSVLLASFTPPLKALQNMSKTLDLPFQDLLTLRAGSRPADNPPPLYSRRPGFSFDLSCLTNDGRKLLYTPGDAINPSRLSRHSSLDKTQSEAILNSLGRSFALIQGPPGTGKSYTGEALIKVLLANKSKARLGPIICVCYTNHALDQLLEHLLDGGVQNIIRIGSRSKSDRLAPVNLRAVARDMTRTAAEGQALYKSVETLDGDTDQIRDTLSNFIFSKDNEKIRHHLAERYPAQYEELMGPTLPNFEDEGEGWQTVSYSRGNVFKKWLAGGLSTNATRPLRHLRHLKLSELYHQERILLYQGWLDEVLRGEIDSLSNMHKVYQEHKDNNSKIRSSIDLRCLQEANIIGVTTTGLATNLDLLRRVHGKVFVCEEAGEVLEAHLLTALLPTIEHAILIGDHLQLRPQIQDWRLQRANPAGVKYSLDVSLFERLVQPLPNVPRIPFSVLDTQRRMHPSIAELVRSTLYPSLSDSENVQDYPEIPGMARRLFWLHHESPESGGKSDQDSAETSYSNDLEIELVSALVSHLLRQGVYKSGEIAVLTPYLGQLNKLRQKLSSVMQIVINDRDMDDLAEMEPASTSQGSLMIVRQAAKTNALSGVRAATVDNFQGEEANVVIISLVRSNNDNRCGFLSTSNRINVLLSRAKHGMYIIGNSHTSSHVPMWAQVTEILQNGGNFGNRLELQCPRHPQNKSFVSQPEDFLRFSPDGGCKLRCDRRLACGHACTGPCHSDHLHNAIKCLEDCVRPKENCDHPCRRRCGEPCDKLCTEVLHGVGLKLPCGHTLDTVACWKAQDPSVIKCVVQVDKVVPGCAHAVKVSCHVDVTRDSYLCRTECGFQRPCGHACKSLCSACRIRKDGKVVEEDHKACRQTCGRSYTSCSHSCRAACHGDELCPPCSSPCQNQCVHSKCGKKCHEPCPPCAEETCPSSCPHSKCTMPCAAPCDWIPCTKRCAEVLKCGHQCPSVCGERCPAERYCQTCAADDIKNRVVDLILMDDYRSVDLDEEPCIFPDCGHFYTYTTMDGQMGLRDLYDASPEGVPTAVKSGSHPFSVTNIKVCPDCRGSLRNISRYGRIVRRGLLDESTRKFISWAHSVKQKLTDAFFAAQDNLQKMEKNKFSFPTTQLGFPMAQSTFALRGSRQQQMTHLFKLTGNTRHAVLKTLRHQIADFLGSVRKEEQPYQRVAHLVWHVNKRRQTSDYSFDESAIQMGGYLDAMTLSLRCDLLLVSDYISLCCNTTDNDSDGAKSASIDPMPYIKDCKQLIENARMRNYSRLEVEGHICLAMFCYFAPPDEAEPTTDAPEAPEAENSSTKASMIKLGDGHLLEAEKIIKANPSAATLAFEVETARRMLHDGVFYSEVSTDEMRAVYAAMSKEFSGTGHWYTCRNGHPFTIGECGMAMQQTVCPECNAPVGGRNHSSAEGVRHAAEIDALARGIDRMGL